MRSFSCLPLLASLLVTTSGRVAAGDLRHVEDATLRSVFFIDDKEGWVVGDEGVILHTLSSGTTWERQSIGGLRSSLRSVHFLTPDVGWAVGREELPHGMGSVGVVLFTRNGGLKWETQLANTLPGLNQVRFVDAKTGYLLGDGSDRFPSGVFKTGDGGRSWEPVAGPRTTTWLAGDFYDGDSGILAGGWSRLATLRKQKYTLAEHAESLSGRDVAGLQILGRKTLAVAQGGLILTSGSGGSAWDFAKTKLPTELLANLDFHALHAVKDQVWVVGRPGSVVLTSPDAGATWSMHKTGQALPLHGIYFFDEKLGWAVGDAGTILATSDGGKSWTSLHQAGKRDAALCIHALTQDAPVDTAALLGAAEGFLLTSLRVAAADPATIASAGALDARRYAAAMRRAGALTGESLWHFPVPQHLERCDKSAILAHWNKLHADRAQDELLRQLVLTLRIWRPSVLFSEDPESATPLSALVGDAVCEAVRQAADPKAFPQQIDDLGLQPWQVRKVYAAGAPKGTTLTQDNDEPQPRLQATVREFAADAHALLTPRYQALPAKRSHRLCLNHDGKSGFERHWLQGIEQAVGESKRDVKIDDKSDDNLVRAIVQRRNAVALAENLDDPARTLALVPIQLDKLSDEHAAPAAFAIAGRFVERGQWYLAQEVYLYMIDRCPAHPLSAEAYRWLIRLNTSNEARRRNALKHFAITDSLGIARKDGPPLAKDNNPILRVGNVEPAPGKGLLTSNPDVRAWSSGSRELSKRLGGYGPIHAFDPAMLLCAQSARRQLGEAGAAQDWFAKFRGVVPSGPWHDAAQQELWLVQRDQAASRRIGRCRYTEVRPFLDGKFDDPCWQDAKPMVLDNAVGATTQEYATEAMFAFDQEFLYVALKCQHPAGQNVAPVKPRTRDAELEPFDRVGILLDLDRDYSTYYHLEVDQRGCVRDSCWGDANWNPRWFVAVHSTDTCWQIEAAIPLAELTGERITQDTAWAFNLVRTLPGRGVQSWSLPADVRPRPEGMSLLLFQTGGAARPMPREAP